MSSMQFNLHQLDRYGCVKPPPWFYAALLFLLRPWFVAIGALASRGQTEDLLRLFYPDWHQLLWSMLLCSPLVLVFIAVGRRRPEAGKLTRLIWRSCYWLFGLVIVQDGYHLVQQVSALRGTFSWPTGLSVCFLLWIVLLLVTSKQLKQAIKEFPGEA